MTIKSLILIRGLPGSGKSTLANILSENNQYPVYSIDDFFTNKKTGEYQFEFQKNHIAYKDCKEKTETSLKNGIEKVFVDNTFTIEWEMKPYFELASRYGYKIFVVTVENRHDGKSIHPISQQQLEKMATKYKVKL